MGFPPDDVLVEDCGILPSWLHRNLEILRQLDCRASVFDHEVRRAMLQMVKLSSTRATCPQSLLKKRGSLDRFESQSRIYNTDPVQLPTDVEPPSKRRRYQSSEIRHSPVSFPDHPTEIDSQPLTSTPDPTSQTSTAPSTPRLSPKLHHLSQQSTPHHKLYSRQSCPSHVSPSSSTQCSDSPGSFVSSSPLTPTDHLPSEASLPSRHLSFDRTPKHEEHPSLLPDLVPIDEHDNEPLSAVTHPPTPLPHFSRSHSIKPPLELSAAQYLLSRRRALIVQKLSLLHQGSLFIKQEHERFIQRHQNGVQQGPTPSASCSATPAESVCSSTGRRLRSSTMNHHQSPLPSRTATVGPSTRLQTKNEVQQQQPQIKNERSLDSSTTVEKRRTRAGSIHSSSGSNSGASTMTRLRQRKVSTPALTSQPTASTVASEHVQHPITSQPPSERLTVAHRSTTTKRQSPSPAITGACPSSNSTQLSDQQTNHQHHHQSSTQSTVNRNTSESSKPTSHSVSYEPLVPSASPSPITSSTPPSDNPNNTTSSPPPRVDPPIPSTSPPHLTNTSIPSPHSSSHFFDPHPHITHPHYQNGVTPSQLGNDPLSFFAAYSHPMSQMSHAMTQHHPATLLHRPFGLYDPRTIPQSPTVERSASQISFSTPGIPPLHESTNSPYSIDPSTLFHAPRDHQFIGISHQSQSLSQTPALSQSTPPSSRLNTPTKSSKKSRDKKSPHHDTKYPSTPSTNTTHPSTSNDSSDFHVKTTKTVSFAGDSTPLQDSSPSPSTDNGISSPSFSRINSAISAAASTSNQQENERKVEHSTMNTKGIAAPSLPSLSFGLPLTTTPAVVSSSSPILPSSSISSNPQTAFTLNPTKQTKSKKSEKSSSTHTNTIVSPIIPILQPSQPTEPSPPTPVSTQTTSATPIVDVVAVVESDWDGRCPVCGQGESAYEGMVACDSCNDWFHFVCVGYKQKQVEVIVDPPLAPPVVLQSSSNKSKKSKKKTQQSVVESPPPLPPTEDDDNWYCQRCIDDGKVPKAELKKLSQRR